MKIEENNDFNVYLYWWIRDTRGEWSNCDLLFKRVISQLELSHVILLLHSWFFWKMRIEQHFMILRSIILIWAFTSDTSLLIEIRSCKILIVRELFGGDLGVQETSLGAVVVILVLSVVLLVTKIVLSVMKIILLMMQIVLMMTKIVLLMMKIVVLVMMTRW